MPLADVAKRVIETDNFLRDAKKQSFRDELARIMTLPTKKPSQLRPFMEEFKTKEPERAKFPTPMMHLPPKESDLGKYLGNQASNVMTTVFKGIEYALTPFTVAGEIVRDVVKEYQKDPSTFLKQHFKVPSKEAFENLTSAEKWGVVKESLKEMMPGGETYKEFKELPIYKQSLYESPAWAMTLVLPSAIALRAKLAPAATRGGVVGGVAQAGRVALAPVAGVETVTGAALKYGIGIPLKYTAKGVTASARKALETALDAGLDRWLVRQGIRGDQANKVVRFFLEKNGRWLYKTAQDNMLKRMAEKRGTKHASRVAVEDTLKDAEPLLLQASKDAGVEIKPATIEPIVPKAETGMPEAGYQPAMMGVTEGKVYPKGKGVLTQAKMEDYLKLYEAKMAELGVTPEYRFNIPELDGRIARINELLGMKGRLPAGMGTKPDLKVELARVETQKDIANLIQEPGIEHRDLVRNVETAIGEVEAELGNRSLPYHGAASENKFPDKTVKQLDAMWRVYNDFRNSLLGKKVATEPPVKTLISELKEAYSSIKAEIEAWQASLKGMQGIEARTARTTLTALKRELKNTEFMLKQAELGMEVSPKEKGLRQTIMAWAKFKGLPQSHLRDIYKRLTGHSRLTAMSEGQLEAVLKAVKRVRPRTVNYKKVITVRTENNIQSLKEILIKEGKLTEDAYNQIKRSLGLSTDKYLSAEHFITESEGKNLIRTMNEEAEVGYIEQMSKWQKGLDANPNVAEVVGNYENRIAKEGQVYFEGKPADASILKDMRFFTEDLQTRTGQPFYHIYFLANRAHLANRITFARMKLKQSKSTPEYRKIVNSDAALKRVNDYIASKNKWLKIKPPKDITPEEIKLANALEDQLFELVPDFRFQRFINIYKQFEGDIDRIAPEIPDAPKEDLKVAIKTYESKGAGALKDYLDTREWGIVKSGFEPHFVVNPKLAEARVRTRFPTGRFKSRDGAEFYPADMNIVQRVDRYTQQMLAFNLKPYVRKLERVYKEAIPRLKDPEKVRTSLSASINEMMGYVEKGGAMYDAIIRIASQAYITVFSTMPILPFRNLFQNLAFHPDKSTLIDPRNKTLTHGDWAWYHTNISQMESIPRDLLLAGEGGLPGVGRFNKLIVRANIYGASDSKVNRVHCYWGSLNKAKRALEGYEKDGNIQKFISGSGLSGLTLQQQVDILKILTVDKTRAVREIATEITNNVHFLYDRAQRAPFEMGGMGRVFGSLLIFPRSLMQRVLKQFKVLDPVSYAPLAKKKRALKILLAMLMGSMAANYAFKKATGRKMAPYNPLNILAWSPGGLAIGSVTSITEVIGNLYFAMNGSKSALSELPTSIEKAGDTMIPFYKLIMSSLEAALDQKYIDRLKYRELRSIIEKKLYEMGYLDKAYEPNKEFYEAERDWEWKIKHAIFNTEPPEPDVLVKAVEDVIKAQGQLGKFILAEDSDDGYVFEMSDLAGEIRRNLDKVKPQDIDQFPPIVQMYKQAEALWNTYYYSLPASDRIALRESNAQVEAYLFLWGKLSVLRNPDSLGIVRRLMATYNIPDEAVPVIAKLKEKKTKPAPRLEFPPLTPKQPPKAEEKRGGIKEELEKIMTL